jgi:hypothetical protein
MKRKVLLILTLTIISTTSLTAQIKKGDLLLGAAVGFNRSGGSNNASSNSNISPRIAIGIGGNSVLGLKTSLGYYTSKNDTPYDKTTNFNVGGAIYWRKYMHIKNKIGWYLEPSAGVGAGRSVRKYASTETKNTVATYTVNVTPGLYYQALPKLFINADFGGLGYRHDRHKSAGNPTGKSSNVNFDLLNNFTFGVDFVL